MRYFGFEAGSRAGLSTELFFADYKRCVSSGDVLILSDKDRMYSRTDSNYPFVERLCDDKALLMLTAKDRVFPCDELTRQNNTRVAEIAANDNISKVEPLFFDKREMNRYLSRKAKGLKIPKTFFTNDIFVKPNTMSAGSKGCYEMSGMCISERINIKNEYVVDCLKGRDLLEIFPRQVVLKNGYDKYIKLLPTASRIGDAVNEFIQSVADCKLFDGIFHLQVAESDNGDFYYIEASKRISGTSIVNLTRGFNPFFFLSGKKKLEEGLFEENQWYRFEDFIYGKV